MGDDKDKKEGVGFSGISSLLPDDPPDAPAQQPTPATQSHGAQPAAVPRARGTTDSASSKPSASASKPTQPPPPPRGGGGAVWGWIGGAVVVVFLIWAANQSGTQQSSQPAYQSTATQKDSATPPPSASQPDQMSTTTPTASRPAEPFFQRPPIGSGNVFEVAEIRYCVALKEEVEGAKSVVNTYSQDQVDRFNTMVDEYNGRCHDFRYYDTTLQQAQNDVAPYVQQFSERGVRWVLYGESPTAGTQTELNQPASQPATPDAEKDHAQPRAATKVPSQLGRTRRMASVRRGRVSAGVTTTTAPFDASLVHARQVGSCAPTYPVEAAQRGRSGTTILAVRVGTDGGVVAVRVASSSGSPALDRAAVDAMEQCRFTPATRAGRVVTDQLRVPVNFTFRQQLMSPDATGAYH